MRKNSNDEQRQAQLRNNNEALLLALQSMEKRNLLHDLNMQTAIQVSILSSHYYLWITDQITADECRERVENVFNHERIMKHTSF